MRESVQRGAMGLLGLVLLAACQGPAAGPTSGASQTPGAIRPTTPPVAYPGQTTPPAPPTGASIVSKTSFAERGLIWRECEVSEEAYTDWRQAEACFGQAPPSWSEEDEQRFGTRTSRGLRLAVGDDVYEVRDHDLNVIRWSTLTKNGWPVHVLPGGALVHPANISLQTVSGKVAWEFAGELQKTVIYGGKNVRALYGLEAAYRPYGIDGKLIFVGERDGASFIVIDGKQMGPEFDEIIVAYCCEPVLYSVRLGGGRYAFWGTRRDRHYVVELSVE